MTEESTNPQLTSSQFANLSNTELAVVRTDLAQDRTDLAATRNDLALERTRLAAERTLMAWIRTSLSLITFGFGIDRLFSYLNQTETDTGLDVLNEERLLGLSFITIGTFALIAAIVTHWQLLKNLERRNYTYLPRWSLGIIVAIVLAVIGLATYIPVIAADVSLPEIISLDSQIVRNLVSITIFLIMLTMGLNFSVRELVKFWQQWGLLLRSQLAVSVLFPVVTFIFLSLFNLPNAVIIGLILLAATPGAPLLTKRVQISGSSFNYGLSLQVTLALSTVLITPLILSSFGLIFPAVTEKVNPWEILQEVAIVQFLPLSLGLALRQISAEIVDEIRDFLRVTVNILFAVLIIFLLVLSLDLIPNLGIIPVMTIVLIAASSLLIGHLLGAPSPETRAAIAIGSVSRNASLAFFIAIINQQTEVIPTMLAYLIVITLMTFLYSAWVRRSIPTATANP